MNRDQAVQCLRLFVALIFVVGTTLYDGRTVAHAATLTVTTTADSGAGSLRAQVAAAASGDTIDFNLPAGSTIALFTGEIAISKNLTITGPGASALTISGSDASRIFDVTGSFALSLSGIKFTHGASINGGAIFTAAGTLTIDACVFDSNHAPISFGGAIRNFGSLFISNSVFTNNMAGVFAGAISNVGPVASISNSTFANNSVTQKGGNSGALESQGAQIDISNSTFSNNYANGVGGAIFNYNYSTMTITDSSFIGNEGDSQGGAINNQAGNLTIRSSTFSGNLALSLPEGQGSAIDSNSFAGAPSALTIINSTFSGNRSTGSGTIFNFSNPGGSSVTTIINSTIADNQVTIQSGGGVVTAGSGATITTTIQNSIVIGNSDVNGNSDCAGGVSSNGNNLIGQFGSANGCPTTGPGDIVLASGVATALDPILANNGGPTMTLALVVSSPALGAANPSVCTGSQVNNVDQRGVARIGPGDPTCDIGAYEGSIPVPTPTDTPTATATNTPTATSTNSPTSSSTDTATNSPTPTASNTPTYTSTATSTNSPTGSATNTPTRTPSATATNTSTVTATTTQTGTQTNTPTPTATNTGTATITTTATLTASSTNTGTLIPTATQTTTATSTTSGTLTAAPSSTLSPSATGTGSRTVTPHPSSAPSNSAPTLSPADPHIAKTASVQLLRPGDTASFTLTVTNEGTAPAYNVVVIDPISTLLQIVATTESQGTDSINGPTVAFNVGTINSGQTVTLTILILARRSDVPPADIVNIATLSFSDGLPRTASVTIRLTSGELPSTGEHPDPTRLPWFALTVLVIGIGAWGVYRLARRRRTG
jgi:hypothetical protein